MQKRKLTITFQFRNLERPTLALLIQTATVYMNMAGRKDNLSPIYSNAGVHKFFKNQAATSNF
jgi:hypothetical protein